ncbi:hypothetical protein DL95DRAFT_391002, partial [Leptodontidium sp. 2 PMI_412]
MLCSCSIVNGSCLGVKDKRYRNWLYLATTFYFYLFPFILFSSSLFSPSPSLSLSLSLSLPLCPTS